jgi:hypothetical protein
MTTTIHTQDTAIVWLIGYSLFVTLGGWITVLAFRLRSHVLQPETVLWQYFAFIGTTGLITGILGLAWVLDGGSSPLLAGVIDAVFLAFTLLCALAIREGYFNTVLSNTERDRLFSYPVRRAFELGAILTVIVVGFGAIVTQNSTMSAVSEFNTALTVVSAAGIVCYGLYFHWKRTQLFVTRGTVVDTLLRQLVPVLAFAGGVLLTPLLAIIGEESTGSTVGAALLIMTATALISVTIKQRQHLSVQTIDD